MASTSSRTITIQSIGDIEYSQDFAAVQNPVAPMQSDLTSLSSGNNTITVPSGSTGVTIIPPSNNSTSMILKGVAGDTGINLALTSPTSIGLATGVASFVITTGGAITGVRFIFT